MIITPADLDLDLCAPDHRFFAVLCDNTLKEGFPDIGFPILECPRCHGFLSECSASWRSLFFFLFVSFILQENSYIEHRNHMAGQGYLNTLLMGRLVLCVVLYLFRVDVAFWMILRSFALLWGSRDHPLVAAIIIGRDTIYHETPT